MDFFIAVQEKWEAFKAKLAGAYKSWTMWFNGVMAAVPVMLPMMADQLPLMQAYMPANLYAWTFGVTILGNMILRFKTNKSLALK